jgi:hypothetical protein
MFLEDYINKIINQSHIFISPQWCRQENVLRVLRFPIGVIKDSGLLECDTASLGKWFPYPARQHYIPEDQNPEIKRFPLSLLHLMILNSY